MNPVRAGIIDKPEDYRWNSLGYHIQTGNKNEFLSTDFGLAEFNVKSETERVRRYRRYVYETGAIQISNKPFAKTIKAKALEKERKKNYEISRTDRFLFRTRYFTDSGIIGSKEFVSSTYQQFKHLFMCKHEFSAGTPLFSLNQALRAEEPPTKSATDPHKRTQTKTKITLPKSMPLAES